MCECLLGRDGGVFSGTLRNNESAHQLSRMCLCMRPRVRDKQCALREKETWFRKIKKAGVTYAQTTQRAVT